MSNGTKPLVWSGKNIGDIMLDVVFVAPRHSSKHIFRGGRGKTLARAMAAGTAAWSFNLEVFNYLQSLGVRVFVIEDRDTGRYYWRAMEKLETIGFVRNFGEGSQRYIPLKQWNTADSLDGIINAVKSIFKMQ